VYCNAKSTHFAECDRFNQPASGGIERNFPLTHGESGQIDGRIAEIRALKPFVAC